MTVDTQSYELALYFLQDEPCNTEENRQNLAEAVQQAVEDWFDDLLTNPAKHGF